MIDRSTVRVSVRLILCQAALLAVVGCSSDSEPKPLDAEQFYRPNDIRRPADVGGALPPGPRPAVRLSESPDSGTPDKKAPPAPALKPEHPTFLSKQLQTQANAAAVATTVPSTEPAPKPAFAPGQFISIGGVIAEVNGTPIYADDLLRSVAPLLAARAKSLDEQSFRNLASSEINRQVDEMIRAEVAYAAAERNTGPEDKQMAERYTEQWRDTLKTDNKGSMEEVRKSFRDQGTTYDEAAKAENRLNLSRVFYTKKLFPRIQVTADDMRRYYDKNRDTLFTQRDQITFRLIKISAASMGSDAAAQQKIDDIAAKARQGQDFETLAGQFNNDPLLMRTKGLVGPIDRGAYVLDDVEKALWKLDIGQITPVIHVGDSYFIAKLEGKKMGRVMSFDEDAVQQKILDTLRGEQFMRLRNEMDAQLRRDSVVSKNESMFDATVDMAMQNYPRWHGK
ncbi:MAG: peptidylprolyl isomerase [Tepidisphaeraceae bacterium]